MSTIRMNLGEHSYDIVLERGCLNRAGELLNLDRKVLVVTDTGVPDVYARTIAAQCREAYIVTIPEGERSKTLDTWKQLLTAMLEHGFSRKDCVAAVGGGVVGDISGFAAAAYMRGIEFYNIPTTVLSQVDSSIGGKTAVDFCGMKNIIGAFHQPKGVLVDTDTLKTLPERQIANGLAEAVKMGLTSDAHLFSIFEQGKAYACMDEIIERSLLIKKNVVEQDEKETGLRRVLNFGHTIGHGIESVASLEDGHEGGLLHGECVALGMLPVLGEALRPRLEAVLRSLKLPTGIMVDREAVRKAMQHDKKAQGSMVTEVFVEEPGCFEFRQVSVQQLQDLMNCIIK